MGTSVRIAIEDASQCAEARRTATQMASRLGFDEVRGGRVGIVVTEACTNILKHARAGEILLNLTDPGNPELPPALEMLALDKGPGMESVEKCLRDGYSTGSNGSVVHGGLGQGMGAIRRLSDESDFYSVPGEGTAVLARWAPVSCTSPLSVGAVSVSKHGEEVCGDSWGVERSDGIWTVLVADGLGHGFDASQASLEAVRILRNHQDVPPATMVDLAHRALRSLRGAAVSVARLDLSRGKLNFSGLGNVAGQIYAGSGHSQHLVSVNGTAGHQAARIREFAYVWPDNGVLIMHSDGLATSTNLDTRPGLVFHDPALIAGVLYRDFSRGHDDATVVVAKAA